MTSFPKSIVFAFTEDGGLQVFRDKEAAIREYEGIDVESEAVCFYDSAGKFLEPHFTSPNKHGKILGLLNWTQSGSYDLVLSHASHDLFSLALFETRYMESNEWFESLDAAKRALRNAGVEVDFERPEL